MDMHAEQMLRDCEVCNRRFAVRYEFGAPRVPSWGSDRVHVRAIRCPFCEHLNPLVMLMYAYHVVVQSVPDRPRRLTRRTRIARHLMVAATCLMSRLRPILP
jgi:hypothetical protein